SFLRCPKGSKSYGPPMELRVNSSEKCSAVLLIIVVHFTRWRPEPVDKALCGRLRPDLRNTCACVIYCCSRVRDGTGHISHTHTPTHTHTHTHAHTHTHTHTHNQHAPPHTHSHSHS